MSIIENYTGTTDLEVQESLSPTKLVKPPSSEFPVKPIFLFNTQHDSMPYHQIVDMRDALLAKGFVQNQDFKLITIPHSNDHAYQYWASSDGQNPPHLIKDDVISYLDAVLKP